jgi:TctA family transporter
MTHNPEPPAHEPEIIPPNRAKRRASEGAPGVRLFVDVRGARHVRVVGLGPMGAILVGLTIVLLAALILLLLVGAFLIWIPFLALFIAAAVISGLLRAYFQHRA